MMNRLFSINLLESCKSNELTHLDIDWPMLRTYLAGEDMRVEEISLAEYKSASDVQRKAAKDGIAWIPCSAHDQKGRRAQSNMKEAHLLILDIDNGLSLDTVKQTISGIEAAIHSSFSHTPEHPKWRVVMPLKEPIPASDLAKLFDHFQERFGGELDASCGHDSARLYYLPACPKDAQALFHFEHMPGEWLDGRAVLCTCALEEEITPMTPELAELSPLTTGVAEGSRNNEAFKRSCTLFENGLSTDEVMEAMNGWNLSNSPPLTPRELARTVKSAEKRVARMVSTGSAEIEHIVDMLNKKYAWVRKHSCVYRFEHCDFVNIEKLRQEYANTKIKMNVGDSIKWVTYADVWHRSPNRRQHLNIDFMPGKPKIFEEKINQWEGWGAEARPGDITPWNEMLDHVFAGNAAMRCWFEQWLAYPLQHPGTKLTTAVVLWSIKQGVGKSMIGETMCRIYGEHGKIITAVELHSGFNNWMRAAQFILGEENSSSDRRADSNKLKVLITSDRVYLNEKYQPAIDTKNCANFMFTSNHADAFYLEDADRRYFVWEIKAERKPDAFYANFVDWRDNRGGAEALMDHLLKLDLTDFNAKGNAPVTEAKEEMIRQGKSDLERWLTDVVEDEISVRSVFGKEVAHINEVAEVYNREQRCRSNSTAVSRALCRIAPHAKRRVMTKRGRQSLVSLINHEHWEKADNSEWQSEYNRPPPTRL